MIFSLVAVSGHCLWLCVLCMLTHIYTHRNLARCEIFMLCLVENFIKFVLIKFVLLNVYVLCKCVCECVRYPRTNENMCFSIILTACEEKREKNECCWLWYDMERKRALLMRPTHSINRLYMISFVQSLFSFSFSFPCGSFGMPGKCVHVEYVFYLSKISLVLLKQQSHFHFHFHSMASMFLCYGMNLLDKKEFPGQKNGRKHRKRTPRKKREHEGAGVGGEWEIKEMRTTHIYFAMLKQQLAI